MRHTYWRDQDGSDEDDLVRPCTGRRGRLRVASDLAMKAVASETQPGGGQAFVHRREQHAGC